MRVKVIKGSQVAYAERGDDGKVYVAGQECASLEALEASGFAIAHPSDEASADLAALFAG